MSLTALSDSPIYLDNKAAPFMEIKFTPLSLARAFASSVLPVPGGPDKRIPLGGLRLACLKSSSYLSGHSTASWSCLFTSSSPPTSSQPTSGTSTKTSLMAVGYLFQGLQKVFHTYLQAQ